ncbi:hypothetical protein A2331_05075 [Candidatus Falkowbacteria bacterium RIFOXYB2_FULL_34_18]|uniref:Band 7 domain-containing protein n=1 Tax=Candidatus Falkowbacteria bacterium RIFOXYD2_FULL_34_120 TaxID=1798007 RepID=A0A1F5TNE8_9BACT|nr:MAG: hypothetical protein A2500_07170 [Candidatus Falkowbacteria bacterium RIFOXYC12_FULL_34_55]OGF28718.1 MAG: hypothetical protein A2331_05075 [Candidatus Falkowbacteria bacterium RIFOXYB2_FULL_34_18]OGF38083.1 MAG: hypothetical protein A2466_04255 [Candidatus Falkowbacteria bacterium RIFOXYC2_FULL_34_220]OGF38337.1 MAG: hypothetical protein A2515_06285 [Candidatus Falkowbacteria bacterium RIFOXYD12_FULL_34_57]OGF40324.1 MAG: hypothetical protein A2531_00545 [Candidatus Falkowbacteria bact
MNKTKLGLTILLILIIVPLTGIKTETLKDTEWGVTVSYLAQINIPYFSFESKRVKWKKFGGGFGELQDPGMMVIYNRYWSTLEKISITDEILSFTIRGEGDYKDENDAVDCRDIHGNRFLIAPTLTWRLTPQGIVKALEYMGPEQIKNNGLKLAVKHWSRSKIFSAFSKLDFKEVPDSDKRSAQADKAVELADLILREFGINITSIKLQNHIFRQVFQDVIDQTKKADETTLGIANQIKTQESHWKTEFQVARGEASEQIERAKGIKQERVYKGNAKYVELLNQALAIKAETEAIVALDAGRALALSGENGAVVTELEVLDAWEKSGAKFFVMPENSGGNGDIKMYDMNAFYRDMGKMSLAGKTPFKQETEVIPETKDPLKVSLKQEIKKPETIETTVKEIKIEEPIIDGWLKK